MKNKSEINHQFLSGLIKGLEAFDGSKSLEFRHIMEGEPPIVSRERLKHSKNISYVCRPHGERGESKFEAVKSYEVIIRPSQHDLPLTVKVKSWLYGQPRDGMAYARFEYNETAYQEDRKQEYRTLRILFEPLGLGRIMQFFGFNLPGYGGDQALMHLWLAAISTAADKELNAIVGIGPAISFRNLEGHELWWPPANSENASYDEPLSRERVGTLDPVIVIRRENFSNAMAALRERGAYIPRIGY